MKPQSRLFEENRGRMYGIAYRMLGSMSDAEDIVQDAWFRWRDVDIGNLASPGAWLTTVVSRLCVDRQRRRKIEKLNYTGPWLPEPVADDMPLGPGPEYEMARLEGVSMGFLFLLEKLTPLERAVFVLRESFDLAHDDIAAMLDITAANSRQLLRRAKSRLGGMADARATASDDSTREMMEQFVNALVAADMEKLRDLLAEDIVTYSDGGGKVTAAIIPLVGFKRVTTVLLHLAKRGAVPGNYEWRFVNGDWALLVRNENGELQSMMTMQLAGGRIRRIFIVRNPSKLRYLS